MNKKLAVVLKADKDIGTGHLMRVKSILRYLRDIDCFLFADSLSSELESFCCEYKEIIRGSSTELLAKIKKLNPNLILIDHYFLDYEFEKELYDSFKIAVIDDLERRHCCHILFDQGREKTSRAYEGKVPLGCRLCIGIHYNFIRPECAHIQKIQADSNKPRVLVNFGGSDPAHACLYTVKSIIEAKLYQSYDFTVFSGISNPDHETIAQLLKNIKEIKHYRHCDDIVSQFARTDLAIGACGGMFVERILAKLPAINVEIADNQKGTATFVKEYNLGVVMQINELSVNQVLSDNLTILNANRSIYAHNCEKIYDPDGLLNVKDSLLSFLE